MLQDREWAGDISFNVGGTDASPKPGTPCWEQAVRERVSPLPGRVLGAPGALFCPWGVAAGLESVVPPCSPIGGEGGVERMRLPGPVQSSLLPSSRSSPVLWLVSWPLPLWAWPRVGLQPQDPCKRLEQPTSCICQVCLPALAKGGVRSDPGSPRKRGHSPQMPCQGGTCAWSA